MLCYVTLRYVMLCYVMLCYVMLCYVMLFYVMLCYVMLCYVMLCYHFYIIILKIKNELRIAPGSDFSHPIKYSGCPRDRRK